MNRILKYIPLLLVLITLVSCSSQKVTISAKPGIKIYDTDWRGHYKEFVEVGPSGKEKVELSFGDNNNKSKLLLYKDAESGKFVPFALDLNEKEGYSNAKYFLCLYGGILTTIGLVIGLFVYRGVLYMALAGAALLGTGIAIRNNYYQNQQTVYDVTFTPLVRTADYKTFVPKSQREKTQNASGNTKTNAGKKSDNSRYKANADYTQNVVGSYIGNGKLLLNNSIVEKYSDIKVVVEKINGEANTVLVNILLKDGTPYFGSKSTYTIIKNEDEYVLQHERVNSTISINQYGELTYINNDVEDDNGTNILKINADKE